MNRDLIGCIVPPAKILGYLLNFSSKDGAAKARFFTGFGFDPARPDELAAALARHGMTQPIVDQWSDAWGERWNIVGPIEAPDGRSPTVLSAWVRDSDAPPRLVTAFPA